MKVFAPALLAATVLAAVPTASAEGWYADGGYSFLSSDVDTDVGSADIDLGAISGHLGYNFTPHLGVEGEVLVGVKDEDASVDGINASLGLNYAVGAFGKVQAPVSERLNLFARAGVVNAEIEAEVTGFGSDSASETGAGYGVGGTYDIGDNLYLRGDYTRYDIDDAEIDAIMVSLGLKF